MEAADSICYLTMDIEDGLKRNLLTLNDIKEKIEKYKKDEGISFDDKAENLLTNIQNEILDNSVNMRKKIMNLRTYLMGYLIDLAYLSNLTTSNAIRTLTIFADEG